MSGRQIALLVPNTTRAKYELVLAALASGQDGKGQVYVTRGDVLYQVESNGRLVEDPPVGSVLWHSPSGEIRDGLSHCWLNRLILMIPLSA
jgi:hypothetical protein